MWIPFKSTPPFPLAFLLSCDVGAAQESVFVFFPASTVELDFQYVDTGALYPGGDICFLYLFYNIAKET